LQISTNLADRESRHLAAADTVRKAEEKLQPVKVGLTTMTNAFSICNRKFWVNLNPLSSTATDNIMPVL